MEKNILIQPSVSLQRRCLLFAGGALLLSPSLALAGVWRGETLSDDAASVMHGSINNVNPLQLVPASAQKGERWLSAMLPRLTRHVPDEGEHRRLLVDIQYEASRAGLDSQIVFGLIEVESAFRQYAISGVGARGLIQIMPFWKNHIGRPLHSLFDIRTNLRYGCTTLRHYNNLENGNLYRALVRSSGSLGSGRYPDVVLGARRNCQQWG